MRSWGVGFMAACLAGALLVVWADAGAPPDGRGAGGWEYGELRYLHVPAHRRSSLPTVPGGQANAGNQTSREESVLARTTVTWATADREVKADGWEGMAAALKAPARKGAGLAIQRLRVLDRLGAGGWEVCTYRSGSEAEPGDVWLLKRKKP